MISSDEPDESYFLDKTIYPKHVDSVKVSKINQATAQIAMDKLFAFTKEALMNISF